MLIKELSYSVSHAAMHDGIVGTRGDGGRSRVGMLCNLLVLRTKELSYGEPNGWVSQQEESWGKYWIHQGETWTEGFLVVFRNKGTKQE